MYRLTAEFDLGGQIASVVIFSTDDLEMARGVFYKVMEVPEDERGFLSLQLVRKWVAREVLESWVHK